jgi:hypothetical protein
MAVHKLGSYQREAKVIVYYTLPNSEADIVVNAGGSKEKPFARFYDVDAYCKQQGSAGARNTDGTANGWACTPDDIQVQPNAVCFSLYGMGYLAKLLTPRPGKPGDWVCGNLKYEFRNFDVNSYCSKQGYSSAIRIDSTGYGWRCTPGDVSVSPNAVCQPLHGSSYSALSYPVIPGVDDWICGKSD